MLVIGGMVVLAWLALIVWGASPQRSYLDHRQLGESVSTLAGAYV